MHKVALLWQLDKKYEAYQIIKTLLEVDPNDAYTISVWDSLNESY